MGLSNFRRLSIGSAPGLRSVAVALTIAAAASAAEDSGTGVSACSIDGVALGGRDVVSYFEIAGPLPGRPEHSAIFGGVTYWFATADHRAAFEAAPQTYVPAYSGWCATTVAHGALRCPDFDNFKIEDGRLLLFETTGFTNGRAVWDSSPAEYRRRADQSFAELTRGR